MNRYKSTKQILFGIMISINKQRQFYHFRFQLCPLLLQCSFLLFFGCSLCEFLRLVQVHPPFRYRFSFVDFGNKKVTWVFCPRSNCHGSCEHLPRTGIRTPDLPALNLKVLSIRPRRWYFLAIRFFIYFGFLDFYNRCLWDAFCCTSAGIVHSSRFEWCSITITAKITKFNFEHLLFRIYGQLEYKGI